jgi:hypothetical protein
VAVVDQRRQPRRLCPRNRAPFRGPDAPPSHVLRSHSAAHPPIRVTSLTSAYTACGEALTRMHPVADGSVITSSSRPRPGPVSYRNSPNGSALAADAAGWGWYP